MTFYFIAGEPSSLMTMANTAYVIKKVNPNYIVEAIIPYHDFLVKMEVQEFLDGFDKVWYLPWCEFQKNIFRGLFMGRAFKKAMKSIVFNENSIVFVFSSMVMTLNLLVKHISEKHKSIKVVLLSYVSKQIEVTELGGKFSILLTFLNSLYSFMLGCYPMKSYINANGQLMYREYFRQLPFPTIVLSVNQVEGKAESELPAARQIVLPYPIVMRDKGQTEKQEKFVVFFGDTTITDYYVQLDKQFLINKTTQYVNAISDYYAKKNIKVYYKPHPYDGEKLMAGCESSGMSLFRERINAEMLFSKYHDSLVAVYTVSSHSVLFGSKNGIPAYWAYEYCFDNEGLKKSFRKVTLDNKSRLLRNLSELGQIGSIDDDKIKIDMNKMVESWEKGVQTLITTV